MSRLLQRFLHRVAERCELYGRDGCADGITLDRRRSGGLRAARLRESIGGQSEPGSQDFKKVDVAFQKSVAEMGAAGAVIIDPIVIPDLNALLAKRASNPDIADEAMRRYLARNPDSPFRSREDIAKSPDMAKSIPPSKAKAWQGPRPTTDLSKWGEYLQARERFLVNISKVMADNKLNAIVHKSVEHQPTLIEDGINPPYVSGKGVPTLNTFLVYAASLAVPSGFTSDNLPVGITFFGLPYSEPTLIQLAYGYEQATHHRIPPKTTPPLGIPTPISNR